MFINLANTKTANTQTAVTLLDLPEFCAITDLPTVVAGEWSPPTRVDYLDFATLSCDDGSYFLRINVKFRFGPSFYVVKITHICPLLRRYS